MKTITSGETTYLVGRTEDVVIVDKRAFDVVGCVINLLKGSGANLEGQAATGTVINCLRDILAASGYPISLLEGENAYKAARLNATLEARKERAG